MALALAAAMPGTARAAGWTSPSVVITHVADNLCVAGLHANSVTGSVDVACTAFPPIWTMTA